jgi:hypothetical protein
MAADVTFELDAAQIGYFPILSNGELYVSPRAYKLLPEGTVSYDHQLKHVVDEDVTCLQTLTLNLTDFTGLTDPDGPALSLPNAGFGAEREARSGSGIDLHVDEPYTKNPDQTCPFDRLTLISLSIAAEISADGKHIQLDETGPLGEQSGTYHRLVDLRALRE